MQEAYYRWLIDLLDDDILRKNYQKLLGQMFYTDYYWEYEYDGNHALDGLHLRRDYGETIGYPGFSLPQSCSVLEMMIALARRIDNEIMFDPAFGHRMTEWFWTMLYNLGLNAYDDFTYDEVEVEIILENFMCHFYAQDGVGSPFPCHGNRVDLRKVDLWLLMNQYFSVNF